MHATKGLHERFATYSAAWKYLVGARPIREFTNMAALIQRSRKRGHEAQWSHSVHGSLIVMIKDVKRLEHGNLEMGMYSRQA